jgi:hypothetical protein
VEVTPADTGAAYLDVHFAGLGWVKLQLLYDQWLPYFVKDCGFHG